MVFANKLICNDKPKYEKKSKNPDGRKNGKMEAYMRACIRLNIVTSRLRYLLLFFCFQSEKKKEKDLLTTRIIITRLTAIKKQQGRG